MSASSMAAFQPALHLLRLACMCIQIESEDLLFTLETVVEKFGEEIAPYAVGLCQHLAAAFWRIQVGSICPAITSTNRLWRPPVHPVHVGGAATPPCCAQPEAQACRLECTAALHLCCALHVYPVTPQPKITFN